MKAAILNDSTRCVGCTACALACKEINNLPKQSGVEKLSATTWTTVQSANGINFRRHCMHCKEPACVSACPVVALEKTEQGAVIYDADKCMGCRYCMIACPFDIPSYEWSKAIPAVQKCIFCYEKALSKGESPACTAACPAGASVFGDHEKLLQEAKKRIRENPDRYVDHIYGEQEAGGTSVLYLSSVPFADLGFASDLRKDPYPELTWKVLSQLPKVVSFSGIALIGTWWIINRRMKLEENNGNEKE
jgi:formate dehydrogenase iron-sulfur subunit